MSKRTLIIVHRGPDYEKDFDAIAAKVNSLDREITVYHLPALLEAELPPDAWQHPTLTVSLTERFRLTIRRGPVIRNRYINKLDQANIVRQAGIRYPPISRFTPGMKLDPVVFGEFVIIKPMTLTSHGLGIHLFRRKTLEKISMTDFPEQHPIWHDKEGYLVQKFVDTGEFPKSYRVAMFFGRLVYYYLNVLDVPRVALNATDLELVNSPIAIQGASRTRKFDIEEDVVQQGKRVAEAFKDVPLLGIHFLREPTTGALYFLECNPRGNTWHFSSKQRGGMQLRLQLGEVEKYGQEKALVLGRQRMIEKFNSFDVAAEALVEKTHELAS